MRVSSHMVGICRLGRFGLDALKPEGYNGDSAFVHYTFLSRACDSHGAFTAQPPSTIISPALSQTLKPRGRKLDVSSSRDLAA